MALTLSIRDNRAGHCSFRPSSLLLVLEGAGQRAGVGGSCGEEVQGGRRARAQTHGYHGKHGGCMAEARICPPKRARTGLEAALPSDGVRTTTSTVRKAIVNARLESDITLEPASLPCQLKAAISGATAGLAGGLEAWNPFNCTPQ
jgi:hypothetical protein